ncbi:MAG: NUDIX domain-containing protein [Nanoarchaeota archaeon]
MPKYVSCGVMLFFRSKVLLVKEERSKHWGFPKSRFNEGETEQEAALRGVKDVTGLTVELIPDFRFVSKYHYRAGSERVDQEIILFMAEAPTDKIPGITEAGTFCKWFLPHKTVDATTFTEVVPALENALKKEI